MRPRILTSLVLASCLVAATARAAPEPSAATADTPEPDSEARAHFRRGVNLYLDGAFKLALIEFERSYELSKNYKLQFNVGQTLQQLGEYARALEVLEGYLREGGERIAPDRRAAVERDITVLRARTAVLRVDVRTGRSALNGASITLDGAPLGASPLASKVVDAGEHRLRVTLTGFLPVERIVVLAGGDDVAKDVALDPEPPARRVDLAPVMAPPTTRPEVLWTWIGAGALAASGTTFGVLAFAGSGELKTMRATQGTLTADRERVASRTETFGVVSDVCIVTTIVTGAVALYLTMRRPNKTAPRTSFTVDPLSLSGRF